MRLKKDSSEQKLRGAYYTPLQLADAMVELFASQNISTVLEPSCGDGVFLDALQNLNLLNKVDKLTAVEIEPDEAEKVRNRYSEFEQIDKEIEAEHSKGVNDKPAQESEIFY